MNVIWVKNEISVKVGVDVMVRMMGYRLSYRVMGKSQVITHLYN